MAARCDCIRPGSPPKQFNNLYHIASFNSFFQQASVPFDLGRENWTRQAAASTGATASHPRRVRPERRMRLTLHQVGHWSRLRAHPRSSVVSRTKEPEVIVWGPQSQGSRPLLTDLQMSHHQWTGPSVSHGIVSKSSPIHFHSLARSQGLTHWGSSSSISSSLWMKQNINQVL